MPYLDANPSADKTLALLTELAKAGRYSLPATNITKLLEDADKIKAKIEQIYSDKSA